MKTLLLLLLLPPPPLTDTSQVVVITEKTFAGYSWQLELDGNPGTMSFFPDGTYQQTLAIMNHVYTGNWAWKNETLVLTEKARSQPGYCVYTFNLQTDAFCQTLSGNYNYCSSQGTTIKEIPGSQLILSQAKKLKP